MSILGFLLKVHIKKDKKEKNKIAEKNVIFAGYGSVFYVGKDTVDHKIYSLSAKVQWKFCFPKLTSC